MTEVEWILVILLVIPAVLVCWALFKSGELQRSAARLRLMRPAARRRIWTVFLVGTVLGTSLGAVVVWALSTSHAILGLAVLVGFIVLNGLVVPLVRARRIPRQPASSSRKAKKSR